MTTTKKIIINYTPSLTSDDKKYNKRMGRFRISMGFFQNQISDEEFNVVTQLLFSHIFITRAEYEYLANVIYYEGYCSLFDIVEERNEIPWYEFIIHATKSIDKSSITYELEVKKVSHPFISLPNWIVPQ